MNTNRLFSVILICFLFQHVNAQLNETSEKATILTNENVQIEGFILSGDLTHTSKEIYFKPQTGEDNYKLYTPDQLKSFRTEHGSYYESMTILINKNKDNVTVFANQIVQGEISLYKTSIDFKYIYIVQNGKKLYVLQEDRFVSGDLEISRNNFQGVLNIATAGFSSTNYPKISFNENQFIEIISAYSTSLGETATETNSYEKPIHFTILNLGAGAQHRQFEYFVQAMYRLYYPSISRSTSLNLGLNYFNYQTSYASVYSANGFKQSLLSVPLQIQQNLLNKNIRPYLFGGLSLSYLNVVDMNNRPIHEMGFQKNFGVGFLFGAGIEMDVFKKYMVKCEYRHEIFNHLILFGVGYNFSK